MPFNIGPLQILLILVIILIIFGVGRLPEVGAALGRGIREFRRSVNDDQQKDTPEEKQEKPAA